MDIVFLLALVLAVALIYVVQVLRAFLGNAFVPPRSRPAPGLMPPPAWADLYAQAREELLALQFSEPVWFLQKGDPAQSPKALAIALHPEGHAVVMSAPTQIDAPHLPLVTMFTQAESGRTYASFRHDFSIGFFATADYLPASIEVARLAELFDQHRARCTEPLRPITTVEAAAALEDGQIERAFAALAARGLAERRPAGYFLGYRAAPQLLWRLLRRRKPPEIAQPLPPARLLHFAGILARNASLSPPADRQITLFLATVLLSLLLGWMVFGVEVAVILLVIILIHEAGHLAAMWAFGYRNLQLLALPLVGGVAIGQESHPDASHRAWMALAGPVPGVLIGLAMYPLASVLPMEPPDWYYTAANLFVIVNLINLAPFAPLDGWHVLRALLPGNYVVLSAWLLAIGSVLGALLSMAMGFVVLAVILGLQLFTVPALLQQGRLIQQLRGAGMPDARLDRSVRLRTVLQRLDALAGTTATVQPRLAIAEAALEVQDLRPMRTGQRLLVGGTFLTMLGLPLAVVLSWLLTALPGSPDLPDMPDAAQELPQQREALAGLDLAQLLDRYQALTDSRATNLAVPAGLGEAELQAAEQRLGVALPADLRALYAQHDGLDVVGLPPLAELDWQPAPADVWADQLEFQEPDLLAEAGADPHTEVLWFRSLEHGRPEPAPADRRFLGASQYADLLIDPTPNAPSVYYAHTLHTAGSIRSLLRERVAQEAVRAQLAQHLEAQVRVMALQLRELEIPEIIERGDVRQMIPWYLRWQLPRSEPTAATAIDWAALDARLPAPLPADLRQALEHGGSASGVPLDPAAVRPLRLTPIIEQRFVRRYRDPYCVPVDAADCAVAAVEAEGLQGCVTIRGRTPTTLWCPQRPTHPYLTSEGQAFVDFRSLLAWEVGGVALYLED